jgi:hypothetical protein
MENDDASNAAGGVKDMDLPWSNCKTSRKGPTGEKFNDSGCPTDTPIRFTTGNTQKFFRADPRGH